MGLRLRESGPGLLVVRVRVLRCVGHVGTLGKWIWVDDGLVRLVRSGQYEGACWTVGLALLKVWRTKEVRAPSDVALEE